MPYVVTQPCCGDASCVLACPVNCIHPAPDEPGFATAEMVYIDVDSCVGCGACVTACPVGAIKPDTALAPTELPFQALAAEYYDTFPHRDRTPLALVGRQRRLQRQGPFRVAVVGAGPAGLYCADELLKHPEISVDVLERMSVPHGLARFGVAPDHDRTRAVAELFDVIARQPGFRYRLGTEVGAPSGPSHAELTRGYDAVVYAVGAASDRRLEVAGENRPGSLCATDVVAWYNDHPQLRDLRVPLGHERAVVVGIGNVALDVARILTADPDRLAGTPVSPIALAALRASSVREVVLLGRRGPAEAAFTTPELVGLVALADTTDADVLLDCAPGDLDRDADTGRGRLLSDLARRTPRAGRRRIVLRFHSRIVSIDAAGDGGGEDASVGAVTLTDGSRLETGLVIRAIGYRGLPVRDLPHDASSGTVPHHRGRVEPGVYVVGWAKRGPVGFLGTNKSDAEETVASLLDDLDAGLARRSPEPTRTAGRRVSARLAAGRRAGSR